MKKNVNLNFVQKIEEASENLRGIARKTPLEFSPRLSNLYRAKIYLKREDLQEVRSFKIRGAFNKMSSLSEKEREEGVVTASAGNHAQGVAFSCAKLKIKGVIFMPQVTPLQKIERVKYFGGSFVEIKLAGNNFDETKKEAIGFAKKKKAIYIPPFDDPDVIAGQGTIGKEIYEQLSGKLDYVLAPIGGGGLISGIAVYLKEQNPKIKIVGVEAEGQEGMYLSLKKGKRIKLEKINTFVEGTAVQEVGKLTFKICQKYVDKVERVPEGKVAETMIELYQNEGIITEPAGALSISILDNLSKEIRGKTAVCLVSGGNNDLLRYPEVWEKSLAYQGRKHYFLVEFTQKPGQLKSFVNNVLGPNDDIVLFEYIKKNEREKGPVLIGIELKRKEDLTPLLKRMKRFDFSYKKLKNNDLLYQYLI